MITITLPWECVDLYDWVWLH